MFEGKKICAGCKTPQSPEGFADGSDFCPACQSKYDTQIARKEAQRPVSPNTGGDELQRSLQQLRNKEASLPAIAEGVLEELEGGAGLGRRIVADYKRLRGDNLSEEARKVHAVPENTLHKYNSLLVDIAKCRDQMVMDSNPLQELDEDQLSAMIADGAFTRIRDDAVFRLELLEAILIAEPNILERFVAPSVEVLDA